MMKKYDKQIQFQRTAMISIFITTILFIFFTSFVLIQRDYFKQRESLEITHQYRALESKLEQLIHQHVYALRGLEAYISTHPNITENEIHKYLDIVVSKTPLYIRNIGFLEDTTVLWNYPDEPSNIATVGKDLATVPEQRNLILKVKDTKTPVLQGPIHILQGEQCFSIRYPIIIDSEYWGQLSMVLETEHIIREIQTYVEDLNLDVAIFSLEDRHNPFFGTVRKSNNSLVLDLDPSFIDWKVIVNIPTTWTSNTLTLILLIISALVLSLLIGFFVYKDLKDNYKILNMSIHDQLTGLYNRHFLSEYKNIALVSAQKEKHQAGVLLLDLDDFKMVNDTYGHEVGDLVLLEVARFIENFISVDQTAFRLGGDKFLIIFPNLSSETQLAKITTKLIDTFNDTFKVPGYSIQINFSVGSAIYPKDGLNLSDLLRKADRELYRDKVRAIK